MLNKDWGKSRIPHSRMTKTCKEILVTFTETHAASHKNLLLVSNYDVLEKKRARCIM